MAEKRAPKTATELRAQLCDAFSRTQQDPLYAKQACELSNMAGKIINTARVQLDYAVHRNEKPNIPFLK
jgi:hypothetical protein